MANQTAIDDLARSGDSEVNGVPPKRFAANFSELAGDVMRLVELQASMLKVDVLGSYQQLLRGLILIAVAAAVALSSVALLLGAGAAALHTLFDLGWAASAAIAAACGLLIAAIAAYAGWSTARRSQPLTRSIREFQRNMVWLKQIFTRDQPPKI